MAEAEVRFAEADDRRSRFRTLGGMFFRGGFREFGVGKPQMHDRGFAQRKVFRFAVTVETEGRASQVGSPAGRCQLAEFQEERLQSCQLAGRERDDHIIRRWDRSSALFDIADFRWRAAVQSQRVFARRLNQEVRRDVELEQRARLFRLDLGISREAGERHCEQLALLAVRSNHGKPAVAVPVFQIDRSGDGPHVLQFALHLDRLSDGGSIRHQRQPSSQAVMFRPPTRRTLRSRVA